MKNHLNTTRYLNPSHVIRGTASTITTSLIFLLCLFFSADTVAKNDAVAGKSLTIEGKLFINPLNISGMVMTPKFLALATDEGTKIQILPRKDGRFIAEPSGVIELNSGPSLAQTKHAIEFDLEALAWQAPYLYAIGSHSKKRKKLSATLDKAENIKRITPIIDEPDRQVLFRIQLSEALKPIAIERISLHPQLQKSQILAPFLALPSKENGIDIEGLAVRNELGTTQLFIGFRGPVLRGNLTPILKLTLESSDFQVRKSKLLLVNLGGLGVRDLTYFEHQFTILAGAVNEVPHRFTLSNWSGKTQFKPLEPLEPLLTLTATPHNPEAISMQNLPDRGVWIAQDGALNGQIQFYNLPKPVKLPACCLNTSH